MEHANVCGIVVTFHPTLEMVENLRSLLDQLDALVVVDNGSTEATRIALRNASRALGFHLIENQENLGIAEALNQGVTWARSKEFAWVLLFDQDSRLTKGFVDSMFRTWTAHPRRELVATVRPRYIDPKSGKEGLVYLTSDGSPLYSLTSGSLMPTWVFDAIGDFPAEYFIDYVDIEYSLRARTKGYLIIQAHDAVLLHAVGAPTTHKLLGLFRYEVTNHNPLRRYYIVRNRITAARKYFRQFPHWFISDFIYMSKEITKIALAESDKRQKLNAVARGAIDALAGRLGKCPHHLIPTKARVTA